ncbi:hypothetical protein LCGC14_2685220, partial [marine sediment metagenome]
WKSVLAHYGAPHEKIEMIAADCNTTPEKVQCGLDMVANANRLEERPSWNDILMTMACIYCLRSPDPRTWHGCVIVDDNNHPVGWGYNGFPRGGTNHLYPTDRSKLRYIAHSELNALLNRTMNTKGGTVYVTGEPCCGCMVAMIQAGIKKIIYGEISSHMISKEDQKAVRFMADDCNIALIPYEPDKASPYDVMKQTHEYLVLKGWSNYGQETGKEISR